MADAAEARAAVQLRLAQEAARLGYWDLDLSTGTLAWDEVCAEMFGIALSAFEGTLAGLESRIHPDDYPRVHEVLHGARPGDALEVGYRAVQPDGTVRHLLSRGQTVAGENGLPDRVVGVAIDVSALRSVTESEQRSAERLASLAVVAMAMAGAQDDHDLTRVAILNGAIVLGADGGAVCIRDDSRGIIRLTMTASLGADTQVEFGELPLDGPLPGSFTARTGEAVFLPDRSAGLAFTPAMQAVYDGTGHEAWAVLPLRSADRVLGSLVVSWQHPREFGPDERELLAAFAAQTAQALARIESLNAERRVSREARQLSETLQRSLLTSPPQPDHLQVAVRYAPAAEQAAVGGDWYDAFLTPDGALCLVIGDCVGHDRQAAASMATMRNLARATAYTVEDPPAAVLAALERVVHGLQVDVLATLLLGRIEQTPEQREAHLRRLVWSNAGHLPPILHLPDGSASLLVSEPDLLLGLMAGSTRQDHGVDLPEGSTLLLFTDGLVERRGEHLDVGLERARSVVEELGQLPLEHLCDALLDRLLDGTAEDDVALLAVRMHPEGGTAPDGAQEGEGRRVRMLAAGTVEGSVLLPPEPRSAREARLFIGRLLTEAGQGEWLEAAELAVSEIVTNAVLHAHTPLTLTVLAGDEIRVEVRDDNPSLPSRRHYGEQATTGRGMSLVAAITSTHGVTSLGVAGKVVWFTLGGSATGEADFDALLDAWDDDDSHDPGSGTDDRPTVTLLGMPPTLWLAARQHHDGLLREMALFHTGDAAMGDRLALADSARTAISNALGQAIAQAKAQGLTRPSLPDNHPGWLPEVPPTTDLSFVVSAEAGPWFSELQDVLDEAESLAAADLLLARPALPEVVAVRDWACEQIIAQLAGGAPSPWPGTAEDRFTEIVKDTGMAPLGWDPESVRTSKRGAVAGDDANRIVAISRPLAVTLGWEPEEIVGRRVVALVPTRFREAHIAGFTRHLTTGEAHVLGVPLQLPVLKADGSELLCDFLIEAAATSTGRTVYTAWITPVD